jgi:hypothetical protein
MPVFSTPLSVSLVVTSQLDRSHLSLFIDAFLPPSGNNCKIGPWARVDGALESGLEGKNEFSVTILGKLNPRSNLRSLVYILTKVSNSTASHRSVCRSRGLREVVSDDTLGIVLAFHQAYILACLSPGALYCQMCVSGVIQRVPVPRFRSSPARRAA